jgi:hypothetical protein
LFLLSCEYGEQDFSRLTHLVKTKSNHKIQDLYKNFLIYDQTSLMVANKIGKYASSKKKLMIHFHESHFKDYRDFSIPFIYNNTDFNCFLRIVSTKISDLIIYSENNMIFKVSEGIQEHYIKFFN